MLLPAVPHLAEWTSLLFEGALAAGMMVVLRRVRGTTLAAPVLWSLASLAVFAASDAVIVAGCWPEHGPATTLLRYAAAVSAFCPIMALLGAKRPQDRGWQWVVFSLWISLLVPAIQTTIAGGGSQWQLHPLWRALVVALMGLELLTYLPTRNWFAALLAAFGQFALVAPYFGGFPAELASYSPDGHSIHTLALACWLCLGLTTELVNSLSRVWRQNAPVDDSPLARINRRWRAFRNCWGAFWGLRILNRVNETAAACLWPVRLTWGGFVPANEGGATAPEIDEGVAAQIEQTLDSLLRRFERVESPRTGG